MVRLAIVSDTHIPSRASAIPDWVETEIEAADHVIHAGDFDDQDTLDRIESLADGSLTAVSGNMDPVSLGLPTVDSISVGGRTFVAFHGTGSPTGYESRVRERVTSATDAADPIAVSGHTHEVLDDGGDGDVRILNPGSATGASPASEVTMMRATVENGAVAVDVLRP
ncbi:MAG: metallophosphoesterase family protein [Halodesulfurarchaeum sp.]